MSPDVMSDTDSGSGNAIAHPLPDDLVELIAERFRALAEPTRIRLLDRLRDGEATVLELTGLVGSTSQNVSKHLNVLQQAGIVARRREGNFSHYRIADATVYALCETVCGSLEHRFEEPLVAGHAVEQEAPGCGVPLRREEVAPVLADEPRGEERGELRAARQVPRLGGPAGDQDCEDPEPERELVDA